MDKMKLRVRDLYSTTQVRKIGNVTWWYLVIAFVGLVAFTSVFIELAEEVREGDTRPIDVAVLVWIDGLRTPALDQFIGVMTDIGGVVGVTVIMIALLAVFIRRQKYRAVWQLGLGVLGAVGINLILKNIFTRMRPELWETIVTETSYSFPSGHAMASSALALNLVLIFWQTRYRWIVVVTAIFYTLFVGLSRLYLGVHYPTDIMAGWAMSAVWVTLVAVLVGTLRIRRSA